MSTPGNTASSTAQANHHADSIGNSQASEPPARPNIRAPSSNSLHKTNDGTTTPSSSRLDFGLSSGSNTNVSTLGVAGRSEGTGGGGGSGGSGSGGSTTPRAGRSGFVASSVKRKVVTRPPWAQDDDLDTDGHSLRARTPSVLSRGPSPSRFSPPPPTSPVPTRGASRSRLTIQIPSPSEGNGVAAGGSSPGPTDGNGEAAARPSTSGDTIATLTTTTDDRRSRKGSTGSQTMGGNGGSPWRPSESSSITAVGSNGVFSGGDRKHGRTPGGEFSMASTSAMKLGDGVGAGTDERARLPSILKKSGGPYRQDSGDEKGKRPRNEDKKDALNPSENHVREGVEEPGSFPYPPLPTKLRPPEPAYRRETGDSNHSSGSVSFGGGGWWTFTLPAKYRRRAEDYFQRREEDGSSESDTDAFDSDAEERGVGGGGKRRWRRSERRAAEKDLEKLAEEEEIRRAEERTAAERMMNSVGMGIMKRTSTRRGTGATSGGGDGDGMEESGGGSSSVGHGNNNRRPSLEAAMMKIRIPPNPFSSNQAQTPGWSSPWMPFSRRLNPDDGHHTLDSPYNPHFHRSKLFFEGGEPPPITDTSTRLRALRLSRTVSQKFEDFILHNVFAPLLFRWANLTFTVVTLGLAIRLHVLQNRHNVQGIIGMSVILAIVFAPLTLLHILSSVAVEYFGRPMGIWSVRWKMSHTLLELVFIVLWSAELSLAFDDYFTTPIRCTSWTPNQRFHITPDQLDDLRLPKGINDQLCDEQASLVGLVFIGLILYIAVLVVSLFRIFNQVKRKGSYHHAMPAGSKLFSS